MGEKYGGVIWTDHALKRLQERGIKIEHALTTLNSPHESRRGQIKDSWVYFRTWGNVRIEVVAKPNERGEWVVLSVWSKFVYSKNRKPESWFHYLWRQITGR
ncbi:MAG TPA: DUF4258 domain-containing protein [Patescibacteria group bacterium]|nr:DUF4258 domain-containing protein [Patescibacteria group bacterium]